jgi:two-component system OmpR family sensor kinase
MNRLWVRLAFAFVLVTAVGVATIALLTDWSAAREFRQYVARQGAIAQSGLIDDLVSFYQRNNTWDGVGPVLTDQQGGIGRGRGAMRGRPLLLLADAQGQIVYDERGTRTGATLSAEERMSAIPLASGGQTIGYLVLTAGRGLAVSPEQEFLDELRRTLLIAGIAAGSLGILLGLVISRTVAAPLAHLAQAARAFAARDWDRRVTIKGTDEVLAVAREFNVMAETIQQAESLRRNLMADVAHELRTPLTVLQGNLRAMLDGVYPLEPAEIATLYDETRLLGRLVDDLRELALAEAGKLPLNVQKVKVSAACRTAQSEFAVVAETQGVTLNVDVADDLYVAADPDRLAQVLRNLLANALRHTPKGGAILVSAQEGAGNTVRVCVTDSGEGIAAEDLPHVFDRFYRGDKSRARAAGGTGLGLSIAKAWVEAMGGQIGVESERARGSTFWFTLPS